MMPGSKPRQAPEAQPNRCPRDRCQPRNITGFPRLAAVVALLIGSTPALAAPFVDVTAIWSASVSPLTPVPAGVDISCFGDATAIGEVGCSDSLALDTIFGGSGTVVANGFAAGGLTVANQGDSPLTGILLLRGEFSSFNPGGPAIGLAIDDPIAQAASFASVLTSSGDPEVFSGRFAFDSHACSVGFNGESGTVFSPTTCGVASPDSSLLDLFVDLAALGPGESADLSYEIAIEATFTAIPIPEPPALAMLLLALSGLAALDLRFHQSKPVG